MGEAATEGISGSVEAEVREGDIDHLEVADGPEQSLGLPKEADELPNAQEPFVDESETHQRLGWTLPIGKGDGERRQQRSQSSVVVP